MSISLGVSLRVASLLVLLATLCPPQTLDGQMRVRVGGGALISENLLRPDFAAHALVDATTDLSSVFGLRLGGFIGTGTNLASNGPALGADLEMLVQWPTGSSLRPYIGLGLGFTHTDRSDFEPWKYDVGYNIPLGVEFGEGWFLQFKHRLFGNMFYTPAGTQSLTLITLGKRIS